MIKLDLSQKQQPDKLYLSSTKWIDWQNSLVLSKAKQLSKGLKEPLDIARVCFEFVRDEILHSIDFKQNIVTCKSSDVLRYRTGFCYAKSHLLTALLRANNIPSGMCYQRLTIKNSIPPFCLHGLNAIYFKEYGWYRVDARGNNLEVLAEFSPFKEVLAYPTNNIGEQDGNDVWSDPMPEVIQVLEGYDNYKDVLKNLPDIKLGT